MTSPFELMRHALGVREQPRSKRGYLDLLTPRWKMPYRNHFCAGAEHVAVWDDLVAKGFAMKREVVLGGDPAYYVTDAGREAALAGIVFKKRWGYGRPVNG